MPSAESEPETNSDAESSSTGSSDASNRPRGLSRQRMTGGQSSAENPAVEPFKKAIEPREVEPGSEVEPGRADQSGLIGDDELKIGEDSVEVSKDTRPGIAVLCGGQGALSTALTLLGKLSIRSGMIPIVSLVDVDINVIIRTIGRRIDLPIHEVAEGTVLRPGTIFVLDPARRLELADNAFRKSERLAFDARTPDAGQRYGATDHLLASVAKTARARAVAVILSGDGNDGCRGAREVAACNGLVLLEDPKAASHPELPRSLMDSGVVHELIGDTDLISLMGRVASQRVRDNRGGLADSSGSETEMHEIFELLEAGHGIDFSLYKRATIERRIQRRLQINNLGSISSYVERLRGSRNEIGELYKDLLIGVTKFFRDAEAFETFRVKVVEPLVAGKREGDTIRVWVAACASGEEAYSIGILFDEALRRHQKVCELKIFATDAHRESLRSAATGIYRDDQVEGLSVERLQRYFKHQDDRHQIRQSLRDKLVFAPHNLLTDAPFTRIDVVTCRNMLIYLMQPAQRRAIRFFHFALTVGGFLWLGPSETVGSLIDEFEEIDKRWRLYRKRRDTRLPYEPLVVPSKPKSGASRPSKPNLAATRSATSRQMMAVYDQLLAKRMPPSLLVNDELSLLHVFGSARKFLVLRPGRPSNSVVDSIVESLRSPLLGAVAAADEDGQVVRFSDIDVRETNPMIRIHMTVEPIIDPITNLNLYLIQLEQSEVESNEPRTVRDLEMQHVALERTRVLEEELVRTQSRLQSTLESMETGREELQSTNEELMASNEELQSTVEELHSVNEELYTINAEHQTRLEELSQANNDVNNLLATTRIGVVFLDTEMHIRRFTPAMASLLNLDSRDVGRHIRYFLSNLRDNHLVGRIRDVLRTGEPQELAIEDAAGNKLLTRLVPYLNDGRISGVVLTLIDVHTSDAADGLYSNSNLLVASMPLPVLVLGADGIINHANAAAQKLWNTTSERMEGTLVTESLVDGENHWIADLKDFAADPSGLPTNLVVKNADGGRRADESALVIDQDQR